MTDLGSQANKLRNDVSDEARQGASRIGAEAGNARDDLAADLSKLKGDIAAIQETLTKFVSNAGSEAYRTAKNVGETVTGQASQLASDAAATAQHQVRGMTAELEDMARTKPLGTIFGTLFVGIIIGMMTRGRN